MLAESITLQIDLWSLLIAELIPALTLLCGIIGMGWLLARALSRVGDQLAKVHLDTIGETRQIREETRQVRDRVDGLTDDVHSLSTSVEVIRVQTGLTGSHTHRSVN